jgi:transcriptional regulator with XRE-family HTH domain
MKEAEKEIWEVIDRAVFKTDDPELILQKVKSSGEAWLRRRESLGGSLRQIRRGRRLTTSDCAEKVGVLKDTWQSWEANRSVPTSDEFEKLCLGLHFGERTRQRLEGLMERTPRIRLLMLSRFRPELLAARGAASSGLDIEWKKLPTELQQVLKSWGDKQGLGSVDDLIAFFLSLKDENDREAWVNEVLEGLV